MTIERTLIFLKPDVYEKGIIGRVIAEIEKQKGFHIVAFKMMRLNRKQCEKFYEVHKGKPFYASLADYISRGPIVTMVVEGENVIERMRDFMGATDPKKAIKETLRGQFGESLDANVIHGSDSLESAKKEIPFFFTEYELLLVR